MQKKPVYKPPFKPGANRPKPSGPRPMRGRREELHRINLKIVDTPNVRVVGDDIEGGIFPFSQAYQMAVDAGLDLVEISPNADPPVCKIVDYKKYLYEQKKKQKELKANAVNNEVKEIRFGPNTDEHDVDFKLNHARKFLNEGSKVRAYVFFKGRTIVYKERGEVLLLKFAEKLQEEGIAKLELMPKTEGKKMFMLLAPTKKK